MKSVILALFNAERYLDISFMRNKFLNVISFDQSLYLCIGGGDRIIFIKEFILSKEDLFI